MLVAALVNVCFTPGVSPSRRGRPSQVLPVHYARRESLGSYAVRELLGLLSQLLELDLERFVIVLEQRFVVIIAGQKTANRGP
jgi:hypothetical protein